MAEGSIGVELFRFNDWANRELIDFCRRLDDSQLRATLAGTHGPIQDTLVHLVAAQERYVAGLGRPARQDPVHETLGWPGFGRLLESAADTGAALIVFAAEDDPVRECPYRYQGEEVVVLAGTFLVQAIHHANDHRTQICSILGSIGVAPPEVTGWGFSEGR